MSADRYIEDESAEFKKVDHYLKLLRDSHAPPAPDNLADIIMERLKRRKPSAYIFAAAATAALLLIFFHFSKEVTRYDAKTHIADIADYTDLKAGEVKETAKDEVLHFSIRDDTRLSLGQESKLIISQVSLDREKDKIYLGLNLKHGSILAYRGAAEKTDISIDTPQARIRPVGTEFLVDVDAAAGVTTILVKEGKVEVASLVGKEPIFWIGAYEKASLYSDGRRAGPKGMESEELSFFGPAKKPQPVRKKGVKWIYYEPK